MRRSRLEISFEILELIHRGTHKPTRIMYGTNLSWIRLTETIKALLDGGFLREETVSNFARYYITEKGKTALSYHVKSLEGLVPINEIPDE